MNPLEAVVLTVVTGASHNLPLKTILSDVNSYMEIDANNLGDVLHQASKVYMNRNPQSIPCYTLKPMLLDTPPKRWATKEEIMSLKSLGTDPPDDLKIEVNAYNNYVGMTEEMVNLLDFPRELINQNEQEDIVRLISLYPDWVSTKEAQEICDYNNKKETERYKSLLKQNQVLNELLSIKPIELVPNDMTCVDNYNKRITLAYTYFSLACKNGFVRLADYRHLPPIMSYPISKRGKELEHREKKPTIFETKMLLNECKNNLVFARPIITSHKEDLVWTDDEDEEEW
jgi:hypothetical protein